jgi:DNA-binding MarR family transcriptional regulator
VRNTPDPGRLLPQIPLIQRYYGAIEAARSSDLAAREPATVADDLLSTMASIRRSGRLVGRPAELAELTGAQLDLVRLLRRRPGISVTEAAAELALAANTVSTLVRQLTDAGLVARRVDRADRRVARLALTPETARRVGRFRDRRVALLASGIAELGPAERSRLHDAVAILGRVAARLPELAEPGA